jgi:hypothetical protein
MLDCAVAHDERKPSDQAHAIHLEGGKAKRIGQAKLGVAQNLERKMQAIRQLALIGGILCAQPEDGDIQAGEVALMIAKGAGLGGAAARTGNGVPAVRQILARHAGSWIAIDERAPAAEPSHIDLASHG